MKGFLLYRWIGFLPRILLFSSLLLLTLPAFASSDSVLILKSSDNSIFNKTIERLINKTRAQVKFDIKTVDSLKKDDSLLHSASLIITLGLDAARYSSKNKHNIPVIHSYLTEYQYLGNRNLNNQQQKNHYSILLDQPLQRYLSFIKYLLAVKNIAIIKQKNNKLSNDSLNQLNTTLDVSIEQRIFETSDNPLHIVRDLLRTNDVLLSLPDPAIYNGRTLKGILLTSYRQNKPLISYSPAHVKSGALAAIFSSPENIGNQIADLLNRILLDKKFKPDSYYFAADFDIKINRRVANSLGLKLADKEIILKKLTTDLNKITGQER